MFCLFHIGTGLFGDVDGVAGFSRGECNGYIILKVAYFWGDTLILVSGPLFACAVNAGAADRDEEERVV